MIEEEIDEITLSKQHVIRRLEKLKEYLQEADKEADRAKVELRRAETAQSNIKREIDVWEKTIAAFKEAGIQL